MPDRGYDYPQELTDHARYCAEDTTDIVRDASGAGAWFVSVVEADREYGGSEEGGWYFTTYTRLAAFTAPSLTEAEILAEELINGDFRPHGDSSSVAYAGGDYITLITRGAPTPLRYPTEAPRYE